MYPMEAADGDRQEYLRTATPEAGWWQARFHWHIIFSPPPVPSPADADISDGKINQFLWTRRFQQKCRSQS